tara:strand:+ start:1160 stop:1420 length:261 start_codon:yes stop_codon:yes gene_type:complete
MLKLFFVTFVITGTVDSVEGDQVQVELSEPQTGESAVVTMELSNFPPECIMQEGSKFSIVKDTPFSLPVVECETYSSCDPGADDLP